MAEPARRNAEGPAPYDPERKPDPRAGGWADVRNAAATGVRAWRLAVEELVRSPASREALEMVRLTGGVVESLGVIAGRCTIDEVVIEAVRARTWDEAYKQGVADTKAARCRLGVIDGGRAGPH